MSWDRVRKGPTYRHSGTLRTVVAVRSVVLVSASGTSVADVGDTAKLTRAVLANTRVLTAVAVTVVSGRRLGDDTGRSSRSSGSGS